MQLDNSLCGRISSQKSNCSLTAPGAGDGAARMLAGVMSEAKKVEASFRSRYRDNAAVMAAVDAVLSAPHVGLRGYFTKELLQEALSRVEGQNAGSDLEQFVSGAQYLIEHWNALTTRPYMAADGSITAQSAAVGRERMCIEQEAIAHRIVATEVNARALSRAAKPLESVVALRVEISDVMLEQARVRQGEGPYQVAARVLGSDGCTVEKTQLNDLTEALKKVYESELQLLAWSERKDGLKVGHRFITAENAGLIVDAIGDSELKQRLVKILGQSRIIPAPVIKPIPPRVSGRLSNLAMV